MSRTVLFFGDSNTRGFGVGREARFATLLQNRVAGVTGGDWRFEVGSCASHIPLIHERLSAAIDKYRPDLLFLHCPGGPLVPMIDYPAWVRGPQRMHRLLLRWIESLYKYADRRQLGDGVDRSEREVLYEGLYLNPTHLWKPSSAPLLRDLRRIVVSRLPTTGVIRLERYLDRLSELYALVRSKSSAPVTFYGVFPLRPDYYPGFNERVQSWTAPIAERLASLEGSPQYVDVSALFAVPAETLLLRDGTHLSPVGHRRVADLLAPALRTALEGKRRMSDAG